MHGHLLEPCRRRVIAVSSLGWGVLQELFRIPILNLPVYGYGLMLVLGVWAAIELSRRMSERVGINGDHFMTMGMLALFAGVVGARLSHVAENLDVYTSDTRSAWENFKAAIDISSGGLTFYGGFLLATPTLIGYAIWRKIPIRLGMDIVAPCLMIGLAFGRVGCLLNGCCWGQPTDSVLGVEFPYGSPPYIDAAERGEIAVPPRLLQPGTRGPLPKSKDDVRKSAELRELASHEHSPSVHPTQIYSTINALLIAAVCLMFFTLRRSAGQAFSLMLILYGIGRFTLETLRIEPVRGPASVGFSFSMWVSVGVFTAGILSWLVFQRFYRPAPFTTARKPEIDAAGPAPIVEAA